MKISNIYVILHVMLSFFTSLLFFIFSESVMCYVGRFMNFPFDEKLNPNKITMARCYKCAITYYEREVNGKSMQYVQGNCGNKLLDCDAVCEKMKRVGGESLLTCKVRLDFIEAAVQRLSTEYMFCTKTATGGVL